MNLYRPLLPLLLLTVVISVPGQFAAAQKKPVTVQGMLVRIIEVESGQTVEEFRTDSDGMFLFELPRKAGYRFVCTPSEGIAKKIEARVAEEGGAAVITGIYAVNVLVLQRAHGILEDMTATVEEQSLTPFELTLSLEAGETLIEVNATGAPLDSE